LSLTNATLKNIESPTGAANLISANFLVSLSGACTWSNTATGSSIFHILANPVAVNGACTLTKVGPGNISVSGAVTNASGASLNLIVNEGKLRDRTSNNRFPNATVLTVNSPGIFDIDGLNQRFGAINPSSAIRAAVGRKSLEIKPRPEKVCTTTPQLASLPEAVIWGGGCSGRVSFN
jgi:hypothetical protein